MTPPAEAIPSSAATTNPAWYRHPALWLTLATLLCLAPFANKAVHVDDYLFLRSAKHILSHPGDPFGVTVNWYDFEMPLADITQNPPAASYYLAAAGGLLGWSEPALHLAFLLPALAAVLGTFVLARRFCPQPALATLIVLISPVFWLSATTLMCDVPMLALWLWATEFWLRGLEHRSHGRLALAAALVALAALTKYFGAALIPLLLVYTVVRERRPSWKLLWLALPIVALAAYDFWTARRYGHGMLSGAGLYARMHQVSGSLWQRGLIALSFTGGCLLPLLFVAHRLWSWRALAGALIFAAALVAALPLAAQLTTLDLHGAGGTRWDAIVQVGIFSAIGLAPLALAFGDTWSSRSADSLLLALWVLGTLVFTGVLNWSVNGRSLLPLAPAAAILVVRRLADRRFDGASHRDWLRLWPLVPAIVLGAAIAHADAAFAANSRTAARILHEQLGGHGASLWFQGHWGFQYYMEEAGAKPLDKRRPALSPGDYLITPTANTNIGAIPLPLFAPAGDVTIEPSGWISTMQIDLGAGFYSDGYGPLPFYFGPGLPQVLVVSRLRPHAVLR